MYESLFLEYSRSIIDKLSDLDDQLKAKICEKDKSDNEIYQMYLEILSWYEKSSILPLNESERLLLQDKKEDIYLEFKLFKFKQDMEKQLREVQNEIKDLKKSM